MILYISSHLVLQQLCQHCRTQSQRLATTTIPWIFRKSTPGSRAEVENKISRVEGSRPRAWEGLRVPSSTIVPESSPSQAGCGPASPPAPAMLHKGEHIFPTSNKVASAFLAINRHILAAAPIPSTPWRSTPTHNFHSLDHNMTLGAAPLVCSISPNAASPSQVVSLTVPSQLPIASPTARTRPCPREKLQSGHCGDT
jgi:hypothetical protein